MSAERDWPDPDLPQDPGIPGQKTPEQLPPDDEPEVEHVPDSASSPTPTTRVTMAPPEQATSAQPRSASAEMRM